MWGSKNGVPNGPFSATKSLAYCFFLPFSMPCPGTFSAFLGIPWGFYLPWQPQFGEQKRHIRKNHIKFPKIPWIAGTPGRCPGKNALFCPFSIVHNRKSLGHRPVDSCLCRRVSQGHTAGVPGIFLSLSALFFPENYCFLNSNPIL